MGSWASLVRYAQQSLLDSVEPAEIGQTELEAMSSMLKAALEFRTSRPDLKDRFIDIQYSDLIKDPIGTVSKIYTFFDIKLTVQARASMVEFCNESRKNRGKLTKHQYALEDVSLTKEMVEEAFKEYYKSGMCCRDAPSPK